MRWVEMKKLIKKNANIHPWHLVGIAKVG